MPSPSQITILQLSRLVGLPAAPVIIDLRTDEEFGVDSRLIPASRRHGTDDVADWAKRYVGRRIIAYCQNGAGASEGTAAWLRHAGIDAQTLEGGFAAWATDRQPLVHAHTLPRRDAQGRTVWVTRSRPKVVRIACPWLIRRFVDSEAVFLFVPNSAVAAVATRFSATAFDVEGARWSDRHDKCTFDVMIEEFGLANTALSRLAKIVRGADTGNPSLTPQSAGLLAASLGYSRMYRDDLAQLDAAMGLYDALYRWCRDATDETHA